jgi:hypothetical protein
LQAILSELRKIRIELVQYQWEIQQIKMPELERKLQDIQSERTQTEEEQREQGAEISSITAQLAEPSLGKEERQELEARKANLVASAPMRFQTRQMSLSQREAEARERLARENERARQLLERARELQR